MNWRAWRWLQRVPRLLAPPPPEPARHAQRSLTLQRDVVLPAKLVVVGVAFYYLYLSKWADGVAGTTSWVALETVQNFFGAYVLLNALVATAFFVVRRFPVAMVQWVVFAVGFVDGLFVGGLTLLTGGFDSILYWVFPGLIVLNALCIPLAMPQIVLNVTLSIFYLGAGLAATNFESELSVPRVPLSRNVRKLLARITADEVKEARVLVMRLQRQADPLYRVVWSRLPESAQQRLTALAEQDGTDSELQATLAKELNRLIPPTRFLGPVAEPPENPTEPFLLRLVILWLITLCCYGVQVLAFRQELAEDEQKEFATRTDQLHAAGRLAAEFAHQIKNPLAIINNAAFSLERGLRAGKGDPAQQVGIIQEEVEKADRIITQVMGYAQLSEGRVEKLSITEELDRALERVFPPGVPTGFEVQRDYAREFPPLLMLRGHLSEILVNLLQNARDVLAGQGRITVAARCRGDAAIEVSIADTGPGIPADKLEQVFEAYYTTRPKGTGLGLAIVKHNVELYGGTVSVESELGKGARFTVVFPGRTGVNPTS